MNMPEGIVRGLDDRLLTSQEVADLARTTPAALATLRHRGRGPKGVKVGRRILFPASAVNEWLNAEPVIPGGAA
jgi:predicted DNA-binding transcriptional regulator AlpA